MMASFYHQRRQGLPTTVEQVHHAQGVNLTADDSGRQRWSDSVTVDCGDVMATSMVRLKWVDSG